MAAFAALPAPLPGAPRARPPHARRATASAARTPPAAAAPAQVSRRAVLSGIALAALSAAVPAPVRAADEVTTPSGLRYSVVKAGTGPKIQVGDLVAIRFKGSYNDFAFDDIFATPEPYFYRAGSELILKGIAEAVLLMSVGDQLDLVVPPELAFGAKGRRASAGKPSIPANATVRYTLLAESIPGRMEELIEVTGGEGLDE